MIPADERAAAIANADTFLGELRDPGLAEIDLDALGGIEFLVLLT